ncbi:MAG: ABC-F family ATP-binding cassette domain-containing protein [Firmicutes bacterium]|nr:ABC-F family ATP-binding cassette domain-containing protein [Bacillota bacterium]
MSILSAQHLYKSFGVEDVLEDVGFTVNKGDRIGVVGSNGAGKSTLFKMIVGELAPDSGELAAAKDLTAGYLRQREHFPEDRTVFDTLKALGEETAARKGPLAGQTLAERFEEIHGYSFERAARGILTSLGFSGQAEDQLVGALSGGEKTRLALGAMLLREPDLMLLDEPTNHLDIKTLKWLEGYLAGYRGTLMIISHDRYFLDKCVNRIFEIENRRLTCYEGNYSTYKEKKQLRYEIDLKHYEQQAEEIKRQEELIARYKGRGTEKLVKRAQSREKRLAQVERLEKPVMLSETLKINFSEKLASGNDVVFAEGLSFAYPGATPLFKNVGLDIKKHDRICLVGANGIGKTTLLKIILGQLRPTAGYVRLGQNVMPGYYDQEQKSLVSDNTVLEELHRIYFKYDQTDLRKILGSFLFRGDDVFKKVSDLAGGEKARLALLKLMMSGSNLLIFDEPTNHLDIAAKEVFEDAIMHFPGTVIIVSHDRYLLQHVPTAILELTEDGIVKYPGKYDYYEEKRASQGKGRLAENDASAGLSEASEGLLGQQSGSVQNAGSAGTARSGAGAGRAVQNGPALTGADAYKAKKEASAAARRAAKQLETAEKAVQDAEQKIADLEAELCKPEVFGDPEKAVQTAKQLEEAKAALDDAYWRWMELQ